MSVSLYAVDLSKLIGHPDRGFTLPVQLAHNGFSVSISALGDTGANGLVFIDTNLAILLGKSFGLRSHRLPHEVPVQGFNGKPGVPITHAVLLTLMVDGRQQRQLPMLVVDLGRHDLILGRMWFEKFNVLPDCKNRRLIWPDEPSLFENVATKMTTPIPRQILQRPTINPDHQKDADRRDRLMDERPKSRTPRYQPPRTYAQDRRDAVAKMNRALADKQSEPVKPRPRRKEQQSMPCPIEIAMIGAAGFQRHIEKSDNEIFFTSLYEIDRIIEEKQTNLDPEESREIRETLPAEYHEHEDAFSKKGSDMLPPYRNGVDYKIHLQEEALPGYCPLYKQSIEELEAAKKYINENLHKGFIVASSAPYASPILMARKPGGGLRFCVDYRKLNAITKKDRYPLPLIDETLQRLSKAKIFTKLDIRQGFHRIRMHPDSEDLTTFRTRYGSFKFRVLPFGLTNGPAAFQRYINTVLGEYLDDFATAYIDDILIYSETMEDHVKHVRLVLQQLRKAGLQASLPKCEFHTTRTRYLGFIISTNGVEVDPEKVSVVTQWKQPETMRGVQSFLGFCNFYRRFIRDYSRVAKPLHRLTKKGVPLIWDQACQEAFQALKQALTSAPILSHYDPGRATRLETDASDGVIGAVLSQCGSDQFWHPVAYFSKTMTTPERNYEIHDKEMLAIIRALEEWRPELEGLQREDRFDIITDHRALEYFMTTKKLNARQARWAEFLSRFHFLIRFRPGKHNALADILSRKDEPVNISMERTQILLPRGCLEEGVHPDEDQDTTMLAPIEQGSEEIINRVLLANRQHQSLNDLRRKAQDGHQHWSMNQDLLLFDGRLMVPDDGDLRARLLDEIHRQPSTAHPGRGKTKKLLRARYYWPTWRRDVERYVDNCLICKRTKEWRDRPPGLLQPLPVPDRPWQHITMDFRSFPKDRHGHDAAFVIVDRLSKRPISIPCNKTITAKETAQLFITHVYRWVGVPDSIVSDRGPQFISEFWKEFCQSLGIQRKLSTAHHPQTDGQTEIVNQHIAQRLRPFINHYQDNWSEFLPMVDFAAATLPQESTGMSSFMIERGYEPRVSFDWNPASLPRSTPPEAHEVHKWITRLKNIWESARTNMAAAQDRQRIQTNRHRREETFEIGDWVMVTTKNWNLGRPSRKLADQAAGPYRVIEKIGHAYKLALPEQIKVHPVFSPEKLRRAPRTDPLPGQIPDPPPPITVDDQDEWEVEKILAVRKRYGKLQYKVKWLGYDNDSQWYPARNFKNSPQLIREFHDHYPNLPGPPARLQNWISAALNDEFLDDHPDDDKPARA